MDDRNRLQIEKDLLCARIELEGMIVENKQRESKGEAPAYNHDDFYNLMKDYGLYHNTFTERLIEE